MILWLLLPSSVAGGTPPQAAEQTRSPHGNLNISCQNCHTVYGWKPIRAVPEFDHNQTKFPLRGMHEGVNCVNCHTKMVFSNVGNKCADCHADIHRGKMAAACETCHTVRGWKVSVTQINMHMNRFPLTGAHAAAACDDCHKSGALAAFNNMSTECISCHSKDFNGTTNPKHSAGAVFSTTPCQNCHTSDSWVNAKFDHSATGFVLSGGHAVPPRECADCHKNNNYNLPATACIGCHQNDYNSTTNPNHSQQSKIFVTTCETCHTTLAWTPATIDHSLTGFPLTGMHTVPPRACADCHTNNNYNLPATTCVGCHLNDFNTAANPNHVKGGFPQTCEACHTTSAWKPAQFDHAKTAFPLTGMHTVPPRQCADCHINGNYNLTTATCVSCHLNDFNNTNNPSHVSGNFPQTCEVCHSTSAWQPAQFDHSKTNFPLTGNHMVPPRQCTDCHVNNNYNLTNTDCVTCHQTDYNNAKTPVDHPGANFPTTCANCHDTTAWTNGKFDHASTGWALTGSHTVPPRACIDCHVNGNYNITVTTCVSCHQNDYNGAKTPVDHISAKFPTTCESCHDTSQWTNGKFDHASTGWALTGLHTVPPRSCADCHVNGNYNLTSTTCVTCHQTDYNNTNNPNHTQQGIPTTCEVCHTTAAWSPAQFDHSKSGFPLTGMHTVPPRACTDCHINDNYNITDTKCVSCHQTDYNNAKTPVDHPGANFPTTCATCHDTTAWTNGKFDHASTGWALTGSHQVPPRVCTDCHVNGNYNITTTTCVSCHQADYNNAKSPVDHINAKFPTTCESCHDTSLWTNGKFDHSTTGWPLTNAHAVPPRTCADCHVNGNYNITTTTCVSCHQTDYNNALTPVNHPQANFPTTCQTCHDTIQWTDGKFDHSATGWALTGSHTVPPRVCTDCHVNNNYNLTSTTCITCHQNDYNNAKSPVDHIAAKFPTTCQTCHDTNLWTDGKFDHSSTGWPLTNAHAVPPRSCADCHINGNYNITVTTCVSCHQTDYNNALTPVNHPQANFPTTCETCHDNIQWTDGKFDHASTGWALTNSHKVPPRACTDCHVNGNYNITATTCVSCHQSDYNGAKTPVDHVAAKFPTACEGCHDTIVWTDGVFNHATTGWALTNSHTVPPRTCADCHINGNYNITTTTCVSCHQTDYNNAKSPVDHVTAHFPTTCDTCHDTIQWTDGKFDHSATGWALSGMHTVPPRACSDCHVNNNYNLTSTACVTCHQTDYNNTTTPPHAQVGFPTTCNTCHDMVAWTDATFDHSKTSFPLTNSHLVPPRVCADCHVNNNYLTLPTDCYGCHAANYNSTTNPNHKAAGFPTTCATCHDTKVWTDATFNHTWFNMNHGNAKGVCATCHQNPSDYSVFQCTNCHAKTTTDNNHQGVKGYVYNSVNCYQCHKGG